MYTEFAFVIYDSQEQKYFAACDPIGVKPIYYTILDNGNFYFSKDIGTLFRISKILKKLNLETMTNIVKHSTISYDATMYKNIKRLPPGHFMTVLKNGRCNIKRYWKPENIKVNYKITEKDAQKKFLHLLDKAIFERIDDLDTTGFELSGGLDSSSIVSWVKDKKPQNKITTFSMSFSSMDQCDERIYVEEMEKNFDLNSQKIDTDKMDYQSQYNLHNNYKLNPYWPIFITTTMGFSIIERAKELGIKTVLTGQGGDHILSGNLYIMYEQFKRFKWGQLYKELKAFDKRIHVIKRYILFPLLGEKNIQKLRSIRQNSQCQNMRDINFKELFDFYEGNSATFKFDLVQVLHPTLSVLMQNSYYQMAEEHFKIEFRHPYFDRRLVEFMLSIPPHYKYRQGIRKVLLRDSMKNILPEKIRQRNDKAEFSEVLKEQIKYINLDKLFYKANLVKLELIEQEKLDKYKNDFLEGKIKNIVYFWQLINLEYWYRYNFVDDSLEK